MFKKTILHLFISLFAMMLAACVAMPSSRAAAPPPADQSIEPATATTSPAAAATPATEITYPIVDTGQTTCYDAAGSAAACPTEGAALFGQDAQTTGNSPSYTDNGDPSTGSGQAGTITDNVTGLMWQQSPDTNGDGRITAADKLTYAEALARAETFTLAGYDDWRLPTIKELYSLILFDGTDPSGPPGSAITVIPFIDSTVFDFAYGDTAAGERTIDAQFATSTRYVSTTMGGADTMFGVNFADGRIKGYPTGPMPGRSEGKGFFVLYVRGNPAYGQNNFTDNGDPSTGTGQAGVITDSATGLMWQQADSGAGLDWPAALAYCHSLTLADYDDWRLPNAKELQSIVDYSRAPDTTGSAAIDPLFSVTAITNEAGQPDFPAYWSSTTHASVMGGQNAVYVNFGRSLGYMRDSWLDVHGAGAQRSDPKSGDPAQWPTGHGPQGDAIRIDNFVRCVRGGDVTATPAAAASASRPGVTLEMSAINQNQPGQQTGQAGPPQGPPPEALDACSGQAQGAACRFTSPHGEITGVCRTVPTQQLACVPAGGPPPR